MRTRIGLVGLALVLAFAAGFFLTDAGVVAAPQQNANYVQIVVEAFLDTYGYNPNLPCPGCNGFWDGFDWCGVFINPLPPITFVLRDPDTDAEIARRIAYQNPRDGRHWAYFSVPTQDAFILDVEEVPEGFESCPNSPLTRRLVTSEDMPRGFTKEKFYFWWGCPAPPPIDEPPPPPGESPAGFPGYYGCYPFPIFHGKPLSLGPDLPLGR